MTVSSDIFALPPSGTDASDWQVTVAGTYVGAWVTDLAGMTSLAAQVRMLWGSGGTSIKAYVQSSLDQGNTAYDVALVNFLAASRTAIFSIQQTTSAMLTPVEAGAEAESVPVPVLGDRLRLKLVVVGTYVNTTVSARVIPA